MRPADATQHDAPARGAEARRPHVAAVVAADAALYAASCVLAKFPQVLGQLQFHLQRLRTRNA